MLWIRCGESWIGFSGLSFCAAVVEFAFDPPSEDDVVMFDVSVAGMPCCATAAESLLSKRHQSATTLIASATATTNAITKACRYFLPASTWRINSWYSCPTSYFSFMASKKYRNAFVIEIGRAHV